MKIDNNPKLDFNNVLIRPKRTTLNSRSEVDLSREFIFPHSKKTWKGVPIVAANMDTIGTFPVYNVLSTFNTITCLNKFITNEEFKKQKGLNPNLFMISTGISDKDFEKWDSLGHLEILMNLDKALKGKAINIEDLAQAFSVKKIFTVLKKNKLLN